MSMTPQSEPAQEKRSKDGRPELQAVAMSRVPYVLGTLVRKVYSGRVAYVLESGRYPVAALVNLKDWLAHLETIFPGIGARIERSALARPYVRLARRKPAPKRQAAARSDRSRRKTSRRRLRAMRVSSIGTKGHRSRRGKRNR